MRKSTKIAFFSVWIVRGGMLLIGAKVSAYFRFKGRSLKIGMCYFIGVYCLMWGSPIQVLENLQIALLPSEVSKIPGVRLPNLAKIPKLTYLGSIQLVPGNYQICVNY